MSGSFDYQPIPVTDFSFSVRSERDLQRERSWMGLNVGEENRYSQTLRVNFPLPRTHTGVLMGNGTQGLMAWGSGAGDGLAVGGSNHGRQDLGDYEGKDDKLEGVDPEGSQGAEPASNGAEPRHPSQIGHDPQ